MTDNVKNFENGDEDSAGDANALLSRLRLIEDQPLESRSAAFAQIHEELQSRLDSPDAPNGA